jgi:hypothetical protein
VRCMLSDLPSLKLPVPHLGQHIMIKKMCYRPRVFAKLPLAFPACY